MFLQKFFTIHVTGLNDRGFCVHTFQGAMATFNVYVIFPERGREWRWSQTWVREITDNFQVLLSPYHLQHSRHFNPRLMLSSQIQWADKELAVKEL